MIHPQSTGQDLKARSTRAAHGVTLVELLLVISIMALVIGSGLGVFASLDLGRSVARTSVESSLRAARNWALARQAPCTVRIEPGNRLMTLRGEQVIGTWRFEAMPITGALELDGSSYGGRIDEDGFRGRALSFAGEASESRVEVAVQHGAAYDLSHGFTLSLVVRPATSASASVVRLGGSVGVEVTRDNGIGVWFLRRSQSDLGRPIPGQKLAIRSAPGTAMPGRWTSVVVRYDRQVLELWIDGFLAVSKEETAPVWTVEGPMVLGGGYNPYPGALDDLVIRGVTQADGVELPDTVTFPITEPLEIVFDASGGLDPTRHPEPVDLPLEYQDGRRESIRISLFGTVE